MYSGQSIVSYHDSTLTFNFYHQPCLLAEAEPTQPANCDSRFAIRFVKRFTCALSNENVEPRHTTTDPHRPRKQQVNLVQTPCAELRRGFIICEGILVRLDGLVHRGISFTNLLTRPDDVERKQTKTRIGIETVPPMLV
jgi:hypothetical protein